MERNGQGTDKVILVGGREFRLRKYYEAACEDYILDFPDFQAHPEHTDDGRPFVTAVQEGCPHGQSGNPNDPDPGDCSGCIHFYQEPPPNDAIGICTCDQRRREGRGRKG